MTYRAWVYLLSEMRAFEAAVEPARTCPTGALMGEREMAAALLLLDVVEPTDPCPKFIGV
jgi:hypothetical protein